MLFLVFACHRAPNDPPTEATEPPLDAAVLAALDVRRIREDVDAWASDEAGGRTSGSADHALVRDALSDRMELIGLQPVSDGFIVPFIMNDTPTRWAHGADGAVVEVHPDTGWNVAGLLPGSGRPDEVVVLMAHYDHLGVTSEGEVYNGAFDDVTAVATLLELARVLIEEEVRLERSLLFLLTDGEEIGLLGSAAWTTDPATAMEEVIFAVAVDPIGRGILPDYAPLMIMGLERSPQLAEDWRQLRPFTDTDVALVNRAPIVVYSSDQDSVWEHESPTAAAWFTSPGMTWYHTPNDTPETIDYRTVKDHIQFLATAMAWFANDDARYQDEGPQPISIEEAVDGVMLLDGVLASDTLTDAERATAEVLRTEMSAMVASGVVPDTATGTYLQAALFVIFDLTQAHPGEVPPPFPAD